MSSHARYALLSAIVPCLLASCGSDAVVAAPGGGETAGGSSGAASSAGGASTGGTSGTGGGGTSSGGAPADGGVAADGTCESLCTHLSSTTCTTATAIQSKADCMVMCSAWVTAAGAKCAKEASVYNACCTTADLTVKCSESNLRARDCDDSNVCKATATAMYDCCGYVDAGVSNCAPIQ